MNSLMSSIVWIKMEESVFHTFEIGVLKSANFLLNRVRWNAICANYYFNFDVAGNFFQDAILLSLVIYNNNHY